MAREGPAEMTFEPRHEGDHGCAVWMFVASAFQPKGMSSAQSLTWEKQQDPCG